MYVLNILPHSVGMEKHIVEPLNAPKGWQIQTAGARRKSASLVQKFLNTNLLLGITFELNLLQEGYELVISYEGLHFCS